MRVLLIEDDGYYVVVQSAYNGMAKTFEWMNKKVFLHYNDRGQRSSPPPATLTKHKKTHHICCASRTADAMGF